MNIDLELFPNGGNRPGRAIVHPLERTDTEEASMRSTALHGANGSEG